VGRDMDWQLGVVFGFVIIIFAFAFLQASRFRNLDIHGVEKDSYVHVHDEDEL
jgi:hypothetical protein